jgi:streptogramin lyase
MDDVSGSTFLDTSSGPTNNDYYAVTDASGNFSLYYDCSAGSQVYVYAVGGQISTSSTPNSAIGELASLGSCATAMSIPSIAMTDVTTVATAYAMAGFAVDALHVSSDTGLAGNPTPSLAATGIANAFANFFNLAELTGGTALSATPSLGSNGVVPQNTLNSLANILAACNESPGSSSGQCSTLLSTATSDGTMSGTQPTDTATAAINIAHHPASNITALYTLAASMSAYTPTLSAQPNDFSVGINFTGGDYAESPQIAIDSAGDIWLVNQSNNDITEFSNSGVLLSPATGYAVGWLNEPEQLAIDSSGYVWIANYFGNSIVVLSSGGSYINTITNGGIDAPYGAAFDAYGNIWTANTAASSVSEFTPFMAPVFYYGDPQSALYDAFAIAADSSGYVWVGADDNIVKLNNAGVPIFSVPVTSSGGGIYSVAVDNGGNAWVPDVYNNNVVKISPGSTNLSGTGGYTGGGLNYPTTVAMDGAGNAWLANEFGGSVTEISNTGTPLSGSNGFQGGAMQYPVTVAIDGSGNAWVAGGSVSVTELIGIATPVVTPLATGAATGTLGHKP